MRGQWNTENASVISADDAAEPTGPITAENAPWWRRMFPSFAWLRDYDRKGLRLDIAAGVTLAAYLLPGLGDASLANLPPEFLNRDTTKALLSRFIRLIYKTKVLYWHLSHVSDIWRNGRETMMLRDLSFELCKPFLCTVPTFVTLVSAPSLTLAQQPSAAPQSPVPQTQSQVMTTTTTEQEPAQKIPPEQLDSLVAPIALFPDPLLATSLAASTYPLEIIQLQQWMERNKNLKDKALADAVAKQPW